MGTSGAPAADPDLQPAMHEVATLLRPDVSPLLSTTSHSTGRAGDHQALSRVSTRRCGSSTSSSGLLFDPPWEFFEQSWHAHSPYPPHSPMFAFQRASSRYGVFVDADIVSGTPSTLLVAMLAASSSSWLLRAWRQPSRRCTRHGQDRICGWKHKFSSPPTSSVLSFLSIEYVELCFVDF